jgi:autotransporter-associated beta strand protein
VAGFTNAGGTLGGTGTLTSASGYALNGGTIAANLGAGTITVGTGTTTLGSAGRFSNSSILNIASGALNLGGAESVAGFTNAGGTLGGTGTLTSANGYALNGGTISASLGAGNVTVGGDVTLNGTSASTSVAVNTGKFTLGGNDRLASGASVAVNSTLDLGGYSQTLAGLTGSGVVTNSANTLTLNVASGNNTFAGSIKGNGGFTKSGSGTATLTGVNSYTGTTTVNAGTLAINGSNALSGSVAMSGGSLLNYFGDRDMTLANSITVALGSTGTINNTSGSLLTLSGNLTKQGSVLQFAGGSYNVTGTITGTSVGGYFNSDLVLTNARMTLSSAANYYGPTKLLGGSSLIAGVDNALPSSTVLYLGQVGESSSLTNSYNLNGYSQTLGGLTSAGNGINAVYNDSATQSLLNLAGASTFAGSINGNIALSMSGGTMNLTGSNTYTGATTFTGSGTALNLGTTGSLSATTNVVVSSGTTFLLGANNQVNSAARLTLSGGTISMGGNGSTRAGSQTFSTLTLTANSVIDFANLSGTSSLTFGSIGGLSSNSTLSIYNWNGTTVWGTLSQTGGAGQYTHLYDLSSLSTTELSYISFYSGSGTGFLGTGTFSGNEIVPVPEPAVVIAAMMLIGWLAASHRATLLALLRRRVRS